MRGTLEKPRTSNKIAAIKKTLAERYKTVRQYSEYICEPLAIEDYVIQPIEEVSPPKWHLAHTTWFFEEFILAIYYKNYRRFHPAYSHLFNGYHEGFGKRIPKRNRGNMSRPTVEEIYQYRGYVDEHMNYLLQEFPADAMKILETGLNHEQRHQELLYADIKYILGNNPLYPPYRNEFRETPNTEHEFDFINISEGRYSIGHKGSGFSYDNEGSAHQVILRSFDIRKSLVTNCEYQQFMQAGGYQRQEYWSSDGWNCIKERHIISPLYWHFIDGAWCCYSLSGLERVNPEEPVTHISFYEAVAFAEWKDMRLPTEFEWEAAADEISWGLRWEHTNSAYLPYPGYSKSEGPHGEHNGKFMVNNIVLRGASALTPENHSRKTYRNFLHPAGRWQFNGIRLCKNNNG